MKNTPLDRLAPTRHRSQTCWRAIIQLSVCCVALLSVACADASGAPNLGQAVHEGPVAGGGPDAATSAVAFGDGGDLVWFDAFGGARVTLARGASLRGDRDLACDGRAGQAIVLSRDGGSDVAAVTGYRIGVGDLGPGASVAEVARGSRLWSMGGSIMVLSDGVGWTWLVPDETATFGLRKAAFALLPAPRSMWSSPDDGQLNALVVAGTDGVPSWLRIGLGGGDVTGAEVVALDDAPMAPTARLAPHGDGVLFAAIDGGYLLVRLHHDDGSLRSRHHIPNPSGRLEALVPLDAVGESSDGVSRRHFLALMSEPARALLLRVRAGHIEYAATPLPGRLIHQDGIFGRQLAFVGGRRLLIATVEGILALDVELEAQPLRPPRIDQGFEGGRLRGPVVALMANRR